MEITAKEHIVASTKNHLTSFPSTHRQLQQQSLPSESRSQRLIAHLSTAVKYLTADSFYSKKSVVDGVVALDLHLVSKLRIDKEGVWGKLPCDSFGRNLVIGGLPTFTE
jgi:hypothetical protein